MNRWILSVLTLGYIVAFSSTAITEGPSVTVYSSADPAGFNPQRFISQQRSGWNPSSVPGFAIVREQRQIDLTQGLNHVRFSDVAAFIDPTTVSIKSQDGRPLNVLEQNFEFDLVSPEKLLDKYLDKKITAIQLAGENEREITGTLLSAQQNKLVIQTERGLEILHQQARIKLAHLPEGLLSKPTLVWKLNSDRAGKRAVETTYQTDGITWRADYNLILSPDDTTANLTAWVSLLNLSGTSYNNARLKLIAGDVQRIAPQSDHMMLMARSKSLPEADGGFQEKSFFEYHLYTLPRRTDILQNTTQQIALFNPVTELKTQKLLVYYGLPEGAYWVFPRPNSDRNLGTASNPKVDVYVKFENKESNRLGIPLPKGKMRVFKEDQDDKSLEFVGEDLIDHTPRNETVLIKIGQAFDVVGERVQTDFFADYNKNIIRESYRIELRNQKRVTETVIIKENLFRWTNWKITKHSERFEKIDSRTIHFPVTVPAEGKKVVEYTVEYSW